MIMWGGGRAIDDVIKKILPIYAQFSRKVIILLLNISVIKLIGY